MWPELSDNGCLEKNYQSVFHTSCHTTGCSKFKQQVIDDFQAVQPTDLALTRSIARAIITRSFNLVDFVALH